MRLRLRRERKMRQIAFVLLATFLLSGLTVGVPDSAITGPYRISFDLGLPHDVYSVDLDDPIIDETLGGVKRERYLITITNDTGLSFLTISVIKLGEAVPGISGSAMLQALDSLDSDPRISGFQSDIRTIDGTSGAIASGTFATTEDIYITLYHAVYMLPSDPASTIVQIVSTYPWNEGTLQLLKTFHVEELRGSTEQEVV